ncbi:TRAM domain-containing protein, partial [bacterium]
MKEITFQVAAVADGGAAVGRVDGKAAFIEFCAPGETVRARVVEEKKNFLRAKLIEVLIPSPLRVEPRCQHYGLCGGCSWQHLEYGAALSGKAESFKGFAKSRLKVAEDLFAPPIASPNPWGYRNRVSLQVAGHGGAVGFAKASTNEVFPLKICPVLTSEVERCALTLSSLIPKVHAGIERVEIQEDSTGELFGIFTA